MRGALVALLPLASAFYANDRYDFNFKPSEQKKMVNLMNRVRAEHGACPLEWDGNLTEDVWESEVMKECKAAPVGSGETLVQNVFLDGKIDGVTLTFQMVEERFQYLTLPKLTEEVPDVRSFTQLIWLSATKVGCGVCYQNMFDRNFATMMCQFSNDDMELVGNDEGAFETELGELGAECDLCRGVTCEAPTCFVSSGCNSMTGRCEAMRAADATSCTTPEVPEGGECQDGTCIKPDPCRDIVCQPLSQCHVAGECNPDTLECSNPTKAVADGPDVECDDGNAFTIEDTCDLEGVCEGRDPCLDKVCEQTSTQCRFQPVCQPMTGECVEDAVPDGIPCCDSNTQTVNDKCMAGECVGENNCEGVTCMSENPCVIPEGTCNLYTGKCSYITLEDGTSCDDETEGTVQDMCQAGICVGTDLCAELVCEPLSDCYDAYCVAETGVCEQSLKLPEEGKLPCKTCSDVVCEAESQCHVVGTCDHGTGWCNNPFAALGTQCDDGNANTIEDTCDGSGVCIGIDMCENVTCTAADACHVPGVCDKYTGICTDPAAPVDTECDDEDNTTHTDKCNDNGMCVGTPNCDQASCAAQAMTVCQMASCTPDLTACVVRNFATGMCCDDGNDDTVQDKCTMDGECVGRDLCKDVDCSADLPPCRAPGTCSPKTGKCSTVLVAENTTCNDGNNLTVSDMCTAAGKCVGVDKCANVTCAPMGECYNVGVCDHLTGTCSNPLKKDGAMCDDGNKATIRDSCSAGVCTGVDLCENVTCVASSQCHDAGVCEAETGKCTMPLKEGAACDDGNNKTNNDVCTATGKCVGVDPCAGVKCESTVCMEAACDRKTGQCVSEPVADRKPCDAMDAVCKAGKCTNLCKDVKCTAQSQCHEAGVCDPFTGVCSNPLKAVNSSCEDGKLSTGPDMCMADGTCVGVDLCLGMVCEPLSQCHDVGVCDPGLATEEGAMCTTPIKPDGTKCQHKDDAYFNDHCRGGECVGNTCRIVVKEGGDRCKGGFQKVGQKGVGGYGYTHDGRYLYTDGGCAGVFWMEEMDATVECGDGYSDDDNNDGFYKCPLPARMPFSNCVPMVPVCEPCPAPENDCLEAGGCNPQTGQCVYPDAPDGQSCDDGDNTTMKDTCKAGTCTGVEIPDGCFVASVFRPSQECAHDPNACENDEGAVWSTMEECCRMGNGFKDGCKTPPGNTTECWRAGTYWPRRSCVKDEEACDWDMGVNVWGSKKECCKEGNAFDCGCNEPPVERTCYVKTETFPARTCTEIKVYDRECERSKGEFSNEDACCSTSYPGTGCKLRCKSLDVVLVLDGSGSMAWRFGRHAHGFHALTHMLDNWVKELPLTEEQAGQGKPDSEGVRVGFVQFSSFARHSYEWRRGQRSRAITSGNDRFGRGTGGRLSGSEAQLLYDVAWHKSNFIEKGTYIKKGMELAATMFEDTPKARVLILLTDGIIEESPMELAPVRQKLDEANVAVFGVVLRRESYVTDKDREGQSKILPLLSQPADEHFYNIHLEDFGETVLNGLCDENSKWGAYIKPPPAKQPPATAVFNPATGSATGAPNLFIPNNARTVFPDLSCESLEKVDCGADAVCAAKVSMATVTVDGYKEGMDTLRCDACADHGIGAVWQVSEGTLSLTGDAGVGVFVEALKKVEFVTTDDQCPAAGSVSRTFNFAFGGISSPETKHVYRFYGKGAMQKAGFTNRNWLQAQEFCESQKHMGQMGYLATVTTAAELKEVQKIRGTAWLGGADVAEEGTFRWIVGPESGCADAGATHCKFELDNWQATGKGGANTLPGALVKDGAQKWRQGQPDDGPWWHPFANEDFMLTRCGQWEDTSITTKLGDVGALCEWGGLGSCADELVGSRTLYCRAKPGAPPSPTCRVAPPKTFLGKDGCGHGWLAIGDDVDQNWCAANCVDKDGNLIPQCKPGAAEEKCACLQPKVKKCRCANGLEQHLSEYCVDRVPDDSGLYQCSPLLPRLEGNWAGVSVGPKRKGVPPATGGDGDHQYQCHVKDDAGSWGASTDGQCIDKHWQYFASYQADGVGAEGCKARCEATVGCHAVTTFMSDGLDECYVHGEPVGGCAKTQRRCGTPGSKPHGVGACGCTKLLKGAHASHTRTCVALEPDANMDIACFPPNKDGSCPAQTSLCSRGPSPQMTFGPGVPPDAMVRAITAGSGVSRANVRPGAVCPKSACAGGLCNSVATLPDVCTLLNGKLPGQHLVQAPARGASVLQAATEEQVMYFDIVNVDDRARGSAIAQLGESIGMANEGQIESAMFGKKKDVIDELRAAGATGMTMGVPMMDAATAGAAGESSSGAEAEEEDNNALMWLLALPAVCLVGAAMFAVKSRKHTVSWGDLADAKEAQQSAPASAAYTEMNHVEVQPPSDDEEELQKVDDDLSPSTQPDKSNGVLAIEKPNALLGRPASGAGLLGTRSPAGSANNLLGRRNSGLTSPNMLCTAPPRRKTSLLAASPQEGSLLGSASGEAISEML
eukprot:TRINITY_DN4223_c0_g1_i1.p1 TRINITY_DN4223_c0_g1~~TRINITY_DN4223_c0_g1_i1.p1  ORF type:complete len:2475 (+),score=779.46 TRINITY_DN4223_c0_g1_i1:71-7495(+)